MSVKKVKVSDYIMDCIADIGVWEIFLISGGGSMHLVDSLGKNKRLKYVCNHHEQASAIAAEAYARLRGDMGVCLVTSGPGGTNAVTGLMGAWLDSIPVLFISGQVNTNATVASTVLPLRQLGDQETNIIEMVKSVTKYAVMVTDPYDIKYHFEKAIHLAKEGRPGPVWLDIPLNVQGSYIEEDKLKIFSTSEIDIALDRRVLKSQVTETIRRLKIAKRPVLFVGNGVRLAGAAKKILDLVRILKIPVLSSFAGYDLIDSSNRYYVGRASTFGQRAANFILQNADLLLSVGSRLNYRITTYNPKAFAREAFKIVVDVDDAELRKPTVKSDIAMRADAKEFIEEMIHQIKTPLKNNINSWFEYCRDLNKKYPVVLPQYWKEQRYVNSYCFIDALSDSLRSDDVIVLSDGTACVCTYQAFRVKQGQRVILNSGCAAMGYGLPASIGACFAHRKKRTICIEGDGSLQLNIQELQTIKHYNLPIKLFVYSNDGYLSIKTTQDTYMDKRRVASDSGSGVTCPDIVKIAKAYGLKTERIMNNREIKQKIKEVLGYPGPVVCDIVMDPEQPLIPKLRGEKKADGSIVSKPLEDLYPFLDREEFKNNMIIPVWKE